MSPVRATPFHSPGRKPWVNHRNIFMEPQRGGTHYDKYARRKCRSYGAQSAFVCVYPGFHFGLCPHYTLGYEEVSCLKALVISLNFDAVALALPKSVIESKVEVLSEYAYLNL